MGLNKVSRRLILGLLAVHLFISPGTTVLGLVGVDILDVPATVLLCVVAYCLQLAIWTIPILRASASLDPWLARGTTCSDSELLAADRTLDSLTVRVALLHGLSLPLYYVTLIVATQTVLPDIWAYGAPEMTNLGFTIAAHALGPPVVIYPIASYLVRDEQIAIGTEIGRRDIERSRKFAPMEARIIVSAMSIVLALVMWLVGATWAVHGQAAREIAAVELRDNVHDEARDIESGISARPEVGTLVDHGQLPPLLVERSSEAGVDGIWVVDKERDHVLAAAPVGDGRWIVGETPVVYETFSLKIQLAATVFISLFVVGVTMTAMGQFITSPLHRLRDSLHHVTEAGVLAEIGRIPAVRRDGIGELTAEFNHMLDVFEELAAAARAVAAGDLGVRIEGTGDLQDSFRAMVARLAELVMQIREAALEVAGATAEIHAATHEQERATGQQSEQIREVSVAIERLADSAGDISTAAGEVLTNAEETRMRAEKVVEQIADLGHHIHRVSELLELIRDVADRSDLLALNGSLEATRAGEAGRGFALVANEMRRLAERVTGTVKDVRDTVSAIEASNQATVEATQHSRKLAGNTTGAARRIVDIIHAQNTQTALVSTAARTIADTVASSASAVTQTRASADGLRERAERLERLIAQFEVAQLDPR